MELLRFPPAQSPLLRPKFIGNDVAKLSSATVRRSSRRLKPSIYAAVSKPLNPSSAPAQAAADDDDDLIVVSPDDVEFPSGYLVPNKDKGKDVSMDPLEYVTDILLSKVYDVANESPFQEAPLLSEKLGINFWLKRDDLQPVFSFKLRGAYNMMSKLPEEQLQKGVITASAGNHAQGVALAAQRLNCTATIVMPSNTPQIKVDAVKRLGGIVLLVGDTFDDSQQYALQQAEEKGLTFIPPFDNIDIIKGQGTVGMEIVRQRLDPIEAIFVPIGGGGLVSGIAAYVRELLPDVKIIGVEPFGANGMALSFHYGQRVALDNVDSFADGVAVKVVGKETYNVCKQLIDGVVLVDNSQISGAVKDVYEETRNIVETSGGLALAGAKAYCDYYGIKGANVVAVTSGANMDFDKLRTVAELADVGNDREAIMATYLPEKPGSFKQFCERVGPLNITELKYRYDPDKEKALIQYSVGYRSRADLDAMVERMESSQLQTINLSKYDLVQQHLRYLVGGRSNVEHEILCKVVLPETPGALQKFVNALSPHWNLSLFHYRGQGSIIANVLVGIQVPNAEIDKFRSHADSVGYYYKVVEAKNEPYRLLMS